MVTTHFMDEAEHCNKVAFIYYGRLIADDSPDNLKKKIPGKLYEVTADDPMALLAKVQAGEDGPVIDSYFFGDKIHLLVSPDREITAEGIFAESKIERIEQSMEDVFVYLVKSHAGDDLGSGRISGIGNITTSQAKGAEKEGIK